jgi:hypothetical protein
LFGEIRGSKSTKFNPPATAGGSDKTDSLPRVVLTLVEVDHLLVQVVVASQNLVS